jgi:hypothetical protein
MTPTEMELRVARSLFYAHGSVFSWDEQDAEVVNYWINQARSAIRAMREPTPEMMFARAKLCSRRAGRVSDSEIWAAMMGAASPEAK